MTNINVPVTEALFCNLQELAARENLTVDQFVAAAIAEKVSVFNNREFFALRAARASREKFEQILANVPDVPPVPPDEPVE